jgi:hypothetical protein
LLLQKEALSHDVERRLAPCRIGETPVLRQRFDRRLRLRSGRRLLHGIVGKAQRLAPGLGHHRIVCRVKPPDASTSP